MRPGLGRRQPAPDPADLHQKGAHHLRRRAASPRFGDAAADLPRRPSRSRQRSRARSGRTCAPAPLPSPSLMATNPPSSTIAAREPGGSRATRRLRREGRVPGVLYGGGDEPVTFSVDARELRHALAASRRGDRAASSTARRRRAVLKDAAAPPGPRRDTARRPPPRRPQQADPGDRSPLDLVGTEDAPGVARAACSSR